MWSDKEALHDCLGFECYVEVLRDICVEPGLAPLTLGVFGPWGSGKSSLMRMLEAALDDLLSTGRQDVKTLWFNAWRYEGTDETRSALIHAILEKLQDGITLTDEVKLAIAQLKKNASVLKLSKFIAKSALSLASPIPSAPDFDSFLGAFEKQSGEVAHSMEAFDKDFQRALKCLGVHRLVIFIDDLDRCSSTKVVETFETIKLFLNTPECTFVLGADRKKIEDAVADIYGVTETKRKRDFLEKIVQLPFSIPPQQLEDVVCYVGMLLIGRAFVQDACWKDLTAARSSLLRSSRGLETELRTWPEANQALFAEMKTVRDDLDWVLPFARNVVVALQGNPRQVKRFLNILMLRRRLATANGLNIDPPLLLKLTVLEYAWQDSFETLAETVDPSTGISELLTSLDGVREGDEPPRDSKLLQDWLANPSLLAFIKAEPVLSGTVDLRPFMFLAQTSLYRKDIVEEQSAEEKAVHLARAAGSEDRIQSNAAAKRLAMESPATIDSAVRILVQDLSSAKSVASAVHIIRALDTVAQRRSELFPIAIKALEDCSIQSEAPVAVVATALLDHAERHGTLVKPELRTKFKTKLSEALRPKARSSRSGVN